MVKPIPLSIFPQGIGSAHVRKWTRPFPSFAYCRAIVDNTPYLVDVVL